MGIKFVRLTHRSAPDLDGNSQHQITLVAESDGVQKEFCVDFIGDDLDAALASIGLLVKGVSGAKREVL